MDPATALSQEARWFLQSIEANGKPNETVDARIRSLNYQPRLNHTQFRCPRCHVRDGFMAALHAVPGTDEYDLLRCDRCGGDFLIPF